MKKAISIILISLFVISCGGSNQEPANTGVSGTDGNVDTLQPIYDSIQHIEDSLASLDTNKYDERFGKRIQK